MTMHLTVVRAQHITACGKPVTETEPAVYLAKAGVTCKKCIATWEYKRVS